jgi:IclR family acetate operon transcriptional repressor
MKPRRTTNGQHTIPAVCKALDLVRVLAEEAGETTTKGLAARLGVPRTTCYRILRSLTAKDWIRPVASGRHELSLGLLRLLYPLRQVEQLADAVQPALEGLALRARLTAKVSVRQGDYAVTVARCESPQETSVAVRVGASFHLAYGSSGAVLLSGLAEEAVQQILDRAPEECWRYQQAAAVGQRLRVLRAKGWCADLGTYRPSCHAVSVPLRDGHGHIVAALTIIGFPHELPRERLGGLVKILTEAARQAEKELRRRSRERQPSPATTP